MHEELIRKIIQTKIEIGMHVIKEFPSSMQHPIKTAMHILQEELSYSLEKENKKSKQKQLQSINID
ncbi:hypothetical protein BAMA_22845 [Bacillus manliponensis]|uniref:Uncharacterized protein n=1 Tax=Bacillus manliponensis TaxID=574376 RepID=A0A073JY56_9BACI|nr:hypothetical protein [Bacillus manliponensis]KEK19225.1 hypothetical protein BAMA_22845 [Bacillus manliponensis]